MNQQTQNELEAYRVIQKLEDYIEHNHVNVTTISILKEALRCIKINRLDICIAALKKQIKETEKERNNL